MQGSFWKTVAIVGVLGIGSMAILEVQHRLHQQTSATDSASPAEISDTADAATGDQTVDAMLSDSEFERLLKGQPDAQQSGSNASGFDAPGVDAVSSNSPAARFSMDEPALATASSSSEPAAEDFFNSEPVQPQNAMPPVDTNVRMDQLAAGGNPFDAADDSNVGTAVAANYEADSSSPFGRVQATGFEQTDAPPSLEALPDAASPSANANSALPTQEFAAFGDAFEEFDSAAPGTATPKTDSSETAANPFHAAEFSADQSTANSEPAASTTSQSTTSPSGTGPRPVQLAELSPTPGQSATGGGNSQAGKFAFFSGEADANSQPPSAQSTPVPLKQTPAATAQMFDGISGRSTDSQSSTSEPATARQLGAGQSGTGRSGGAAMFEDAAPAFDMEEEPALQQPANTPSGRPSSSATEFPAFGDENSGVVPLNPAGSGRQSNQPAPAPSPTESPRDGVREFGGATFSDGDQGSTSVPFEDDGVPLPRPEPADFGSDPRSPNSRVPAQRQPELSPVLEDSATDSNSLPFAEDFPGNPNTNPVPPLERPGSISIPGFGSGSSGSTAPDSQFNIDSRSEPGSRFEPEATPRFDPVPEPGEREFGSPFDPDLNNRPDRRNSDPRGSMPGIESDQPRLPENRNEGFDLNGSRARDFSQPSGNGSREFGSGSPMFDADDNIQPVPSQRDLPRTVPERSQPDLRFGDPAPSPMPRERQPLPDSRDNSRLNDRLLQPIPGRDNREFGSPDPLPGLPGFDPQRRTQLVAGEMRPNLVLEKQAPENATVGTPLDYRILVKNEGNAVAYDVVVEDEVTAAARVDGAHPQSEFDTSSKKLMWTFETISPGEQKEITVRVTPTGEGVMDGLASVRFKSRVQATTVITTPRLRLQMAGPDEVRLGEQVAYRYILTNEGSGEARDVFIRTVLPATGGLTHPQGRDLEYEIQSMRPGEQREISLAVVAAEPGEHKTEAEVTVGGNPADQAAWRTHVVGAQLQIVRRGPKRRFVGRSATYENIVTNETNFDALDARVVETIPEGMRFMGATMGGQYDDVNRTVTWRINRLGPGRQEQLQLELMPTASGSMESVVRVLENVGVQGEDYVSTTIVEDLHNVSATISQLEGPVALGETFGFTINIDNRGTADATDVELRVEVPEEIQVVGAGSREVPAKLLGGNVVQYDMIVRIEPNRKQSFELKLRGEKPIRNGVVKAHLQYRQMNEPLIVSESVTIYREDL